MLQFKVELVQGKHLLPLNKLKDFRTMAKYYFFASGINYAAHIGGEGQYQVFTEVDLVGRVVGKSQFLGLMTQFITSWYGLLVLLLIPSAYMIITSVLDIFRAYQGDDEEENNWNQSH